MTTIRTRSSALVHAAGAVSDYLQARYLMWLRDWHRQNVLIQEQAARDALHTANIEQREALRIEARLRRLGYEPERTE